MNVSPATTSTLTNGVWTGALTVNGGGSNVVIKAGGAFSGQSNTFDVRPSTVPAPVLNAPPLILGGSSAPLSWSAASGASAYEVQWDHTGVFSAPQSSGWISATQFNVTGLADAQNTWFRVRAHWISGGTEILGPWSSVVSAVQDATPPAIAFGGSMAGYGGANLRTIASSMTLSGTITDAHGISSFSFNGSPVTLGTGGAFNATVSLSTGWNLLTLIAWDNASPPNQTTQTVSVLSIADTNSNGIPDDWEVANGLNLGSASPGGSLATNAGNLLMSYAFDADPNSPSDSTQPATSMATNGLLITFTRRQNEPGLLYQIEGSYDLVNWSTDNVISQLAAPAVPNAARQTESVTFRVISSVPATRLFTRIRVTNVTAIVQ